MEITNNFKLISIGERNSDGDELLEVELRFRLFGKAEGIAHVFIENVNNDYPSYSFTEIDQDFGGSFNDLLEEHWEAIAIQVKKFTVEFKESYGKEDDDDLNNNENTFKAGDHLWIRVSEKVARNIGLRIGLDITVEEANEILKLNDLESDEFDTHTAEYALLDSHLGTDITDSEGFTDVQITVENVASLNDITWMKKNSKNRTTVIH